MKITKIVTGIALIIMSIIIMFQFKFASFIQALLGYADLGSTTSVLVAFAFLVAGSVYIICSSNKGVFPSVVSFIILMLGGVMGIFNATRFQGIMIWSWIGILAGAAMVIASIVNAYFFEPEVDEYGNTHSSSYYDNNQQNAPIPPNPNGAPQGMPNQSNPNMQAPNMQQNIQPQGFKQNPQMQQPYPNNQQQPTAPNQYGQNVQQPYAQPQSAPQQQPVPPQQPNPYTAPTQPQSTAQPNPQPAQPNTPYPNQQPNPASNPNHAPQENMGAGRRRFKTQVNNPNNYDQNTKR